MEPVYQVEERGQSTWDTEGLYTAEPDPSRRDGGRRAGNRRGAALGGRFRP
jgi:hypothetical protein